MECFVIGGQIPQQKKFILKTRTLGYDLTYLGGVDADVNPSNISIPDGADVAIVLKDLISHKQRDLVKAIVDRSSTLFIEVSSQIALASNTLHLLLGPPREQPRSVTTPRSTLPVEEGLIPMAWKIFPFNFSSQGTRITLSNYWLSNFRSTDLALYNRAKEMRQNNSMICTKDKISLIPCLCMDCTPSIDAQDFTHSMPSISEVKKGKALNPLLVKSDAIRWAYANSESEIALDYARSWLIGAEEDNHTFRSKGELERALNMTFGVPLSEISEEYWINLIDVKTKTKKEKNLKNYNISTPTLDPIPNPTLDPIPTPSETTDILSEIASYEVIPQVDPLIEAIKKEGKMQKEHMANFTPPKDLNVVRISGMTLDIQGSLTITEIKSEDLYVNGIYSVHIDKVINGVLHGVKIERLPYSSF